MDNRELIENLSEMSSQLSKQAEELDQKFKLIDQYSSANQEKCSEFFATFGEEVKDLVCEFQTLLSYLTPKKIQSKLIGFQDFLDRNARLSKELVKFSFLGKINIDIVPESFKKFPEKYKSYLKKLLGGDLCVIVRHLKS